MSKKLFLFLTFFTASLAANSQEFWLHPSKFIYQPGEKPVISFMEGVDFIGKPWERFAQSTMPEEKRSLVNSAFLHHKGKVTAIDQFVSAEGDGDLVLPPQLAGTYMVMVQTADAFRELGAETFNAYLRESALDEAYSYRQKTNSLTSTGKETYRHFAKLLLQVGPVTDETFKEEAGVTVEVIPQQYPYDLRVGDRVQFKVVYNGKPLFGARVKVFNSYNHRISVQNIFSEQNGMIETHISNPGMWMVSFIKMVPSKEPDADWQSYKGTLVFGIK